LCLLRSVLGDKRVVGVFVFRAPSTAVHLNWFEMN
jgi:hypothetical protein